MEIESIIGTTMEVELSSITTFGPHKAVIPTVSGSASFTGKSTFWFDSEDPLKDGFILR
jgi:proline racemase